MSITKTDLGDGSWLAGFKIPSLKHFGSSFEEFWNLHPPEFAQVNIFGWKNVPRWQQSYGSIYKYKGMPDPLMDLPPLLVALTGFDNFFMKENDLMEEDQEYIWPLVNWYGNGNHYIGFHSDDEKTIVQGTPILSMTFYEKKGSHRIFQIKNLKTNQITDIPLQNNSALVMGGKFQKTHKHAVPKAKNDIRRINVTFRVLVGQ
jgi:alpha-ketoglutarate-dependent dioxygenase alkB family protein 2